MQIVFASNNLHKLEEVRHLLDNRFQLLSLRDIGCKEELSETHETLQENAIEKALYVYEKYGYPCFADDTGLEVVALNGLPGVYSARYAGLQRNTADNMVKLLQDMCEKDNRSARFKTVIALVNGAKHIFEGTVEGEILTEPRGKDGFGYDPIFMPNGYNYSFAEMNMAEKNALSHRAVALKKLNAYLNESL